ncbi:MAG TPA: sensor histidine kinase KdpD [Candidatus Limnocylindria bacterium]|nr:sensor histidine kinase KdpD [Candidatus Limnocylindria bacterium]
MSDHFRPDPDALLAAISRAETAQKRGRLKVFLGMSAGVGKTFAMLEAAQKAKREGRDVVIGYVESHGRKETDALTEGLPVIPRRIVEHGGVTLSEMDLDAVLARRPQLTLVDEFAHSNAPGSRHPKRWQDAEELLAAGLDVYATLNVQHIESRTDTVRQITGSTIYETVPDRVLDGAEIELVDLPPEELMKRLAAGKVYQGERAEAALFNFFREGNLTALREIALRYAAGRVGRDVQDYLQAMQIEGPWKTGDRLMVAVSASPLSAQLIRWTRRTADSLHAEWLGVHVESARHAVGTAPAQLTKNLALARELGAEVVTTADEDFARGLLRVARQHNVTQIVVGKPGGNRLAQLLGMRRLNRLLRESGSVDIHVVRADPAGTDRGVPATVASPRSFERDVDRSGAEQYGTAIGVIAAVSFANAFLAPLLGYRAVALTYLFGVVGLAMILGRGPILLAAALSALVWNFFFLPPRYTFYITNVEDGLMFGLYFVVAAVLGQLVARVRAQELANRRREERATALYLLTRDLADAATVHDVVRAVVKQVGEIFHTRVALLPTDAQGRLEATPHPASTLNLSEKEHGVAAWAHEHAQAAGRFTDNLPLAEALHLPLRAGERAAGVLSVQLDVLTPPTLDQRDLLEAFARQTALVLDRQRLRDAEHSSRLIAESERLGKTLLNSISHELRTPLAAITSATSGLREAGPLTPVQVALAGEIGEASDRLNRLVRNLLDVARLEAGHLRPHLDWCDPADLCQVALKNVRAQLAGRTVTVNAPAGLPLLKADFVLLDQAIGNLLANVAAHTPAGTPVELTARQADGELLIEVADHGPGLGAEDLSRVFEKFYRAGSARAGGTGLGLSIVKGFVEANGGTVEAANRPGGGAIFTIRLPVTDAPSLPAEPA